jgi:tetratricopeptide (TPR) repeat protein
MCLELFILAALLSGGDQLISVADIPAAEANARILTQSGKLEQARDIYERVLLLRPNDVEAQNGMASTSEQLALAQRNSGQMNAALDILMRAQRSEPENRRILLDLGILEDEVMLYQEASKTLDHLEALGNIDPNAFYALARTDMNLGRLDQAQQQMEQYLKLRPQDASAHYGLGKIYAMGQQFPMAEQELRQSIAIEPKQSESYYELGQVLLEENQLEPSIAEFQVTLQRDPKHGGALVGLGIAYFKMRKYNEARNWLIKAIQAAPEYQPGHYYLGLTLARLGDATQSKAEFAIATSLAAQDAKKASSRVMILNPEAQP